VTESTSLLPAWSAPEADPAALVAVSFLAQYPNPNTRDAYRTDLRLFFAWCEQIGVHPLEMKRVHLQAFASYLATGRGNAPASVARRIGTISGYYETAVLDEVLEHSPAHHLKLPPIHEDPAKRTWLTRWELGAVMRAAQESKAPADWALMTLMGTLGMRVSAACGVQIKDVSTDQSGYRFLHSVGKGGKPSVKVLPVPTWRAMDRAQGDRESGPLLQRRDGSQMTRRSADRVVQRLTAAAGVKKRITPHSLRRSFATLALQAGVPMEVVQFDNGPCIQSDHGELQPPRSRAARPRLTHGGRAAGIRVLTAIVSRGPEGRAATQSDRPSPQRPGHP
jgi:site-specific recombinase XerD